MSELPFDDRFQAAIAERNKITNYVKSNEVKQEGQVQQQSDLFKLYEVEPGNAVYIRFFPDVDKNNTVYWRPRSTHRLTFDSIKQPDGTVVELTRPLAVDVPGWNCRANDTANNNLPPEYLLMSTDDPVQRHISSLFNDGDETSKELYRRFKAKTSYMMYGIITRYDAHREFVGKAYLKQTRPMTSIRLLRPILNTDMISVSRCHGRVIKTIMQQIPSLHHRVQCMRLPLKWYRNLKIIISNLWLNI